MPAHNTNCPFPDTRIGCLCRWLVLLTSNTCATPNMRGYNLGIQVQQHGRQQMHMKICKQFTRARPPGRLQHHPVCAATFKSLTYQTQTSATAKDPCTSATNMQVWDDAHHVQHAHLVCMHPVGKRREIHWLHQHPPPPPHNIRHDRVVRPAEQCECAAIRLPGLLERAYP